MMEIDRDSAVPVYMQIAQKLKNDIEQGALSQGAKVPNETALGKRFLASRITVRKAVDILVQDGLLERKQGKGTYVVNSGVQVDFGTMQSFYGSLVRTGAHISTDLLHCQRIQAPRNIAERLQITPGTAIQQIERLYRLGQQPLAVTSSYLWKDLHLSLSEATDTTVYGLIARYLDVELERANWDITAETATVALRSALHISKGTPLLRLSRTTYTIDHIPREHTIHRIVSDLYQAQIVLIRDAQALQEDFVTKLSQTT